jgi:hypothetical protein
VQKAVKDDVTGCSQLLDLLNKCKEKGVDVESMVHDVELSKRYLEESDRVLDWSHTRLEELQRTIDEHEEIRDRLLVEAMDGENGLLAGISLLEDMRQDLREFSKRVERARSLCQDFLDGKLEKDQFLQELKSVIPDLVGYAKSVRDSAYKFGSVVDASWCRVNELIESWEQKRSLEEVRKHQVRSKLQGLLLTLLAAVLVPMLPPGVQQYLSTVISVLATLLPLVFQAVTVV